jgi:hypothetical protein
MTTEDAIWFADILENICDVQVIKSEQQHHVMIKLETEDRDICERTAKILNTEVIYDEENDLYKTSLTGFVNKQKNENSTQSHIEKVILQIVPYYNSEVFGRDVVNFE